MPGTSAETLDARGTLSPHRIPYTAGGSGLAGASKVGAKMVRKAVGSRRDRPSSTIERFRYVLGR